MANLPGQNHSELKPYHQFLWYESRISANLKQPDFHHELSYTVQIPSPSNKKTSHQPKSFRYYLWRQHPNPNVLHGFFPEIITTDGMHVRRMIALERQILYQEFDDPLIADPIIKCVEAGANRGVPLVGYSMMNAKESVAILQTGTPQEPGWLAFTDIERTTNQHTPLLPTTSQHMTGLRLLVGGDITWENREMQFHAALEQRCNPPSISHQLPNLLEHLTDWTLHATYIHNQTLTPIRLSRKRISGFNPLHTNNQRIETQFTLDSRLFREFSQNPTFQIWFQLHLNRTLFCLPDQWNSIWIAVHPVIKA